MRGGALGFGRGSENTGWYIARPIELCLITVQGSQQGSPDLSKAVQTHCGNRLSLKGVEDTLCEGSRAAFTAGHDFSEEFLSDPQNKSRALTSALFCVPLFVYIVRNTHHTCNVARSNGAVKSQRGCKEHRKCLVRIYK